MSSGFFRPIQDPELHVGIAASITQRFNLKRGLFVLHPAKETIYLLVLYAKVPPRQQLEGRDPDTLVTRNVNQDPILLSPTFVLGYAANSQSLLSVTASVEIQFLSMSASRSASLFRPLFHSSNLRRLPRCNPFIHSPSTQSTKAFSNSSRWKDSSTASEQAKIYTTDQYPQLKRDTRFAELTKDHVGAFKQILGDSGVIDGVSKEAGEDLEAFNVDWLNKYRGHGRLVLKPKRVEEVSKILTYCNEKRLAVVPQAGNSGLVGGSVPVFDEIVVSTSKMNQIRSFDQVSGILAVDSGCILEVVDNYLAEKGHIFPLDLGAKGSCQIGGNVATNAGGLRLLRYGSLHGTVLGIEAVLPDGTIVDDLSKLRKNNTGYDLKQLFIGSEGTIGIITGLSIICPARSKAVNVAYFGLPSYKHVQKAFQKAKSQLGEILSAFELMDLPSQKLVHQVTGNKMPLEDEHPFYCLIETSGSNTEHDNEKLEKFLENVMGDETVSDGVVAQDETQVKSLWSWREGITEALQHSGGTYKYDLSIPLPELYSLVEDTKARMITKNLMGEGDSYPVVDVVGFGHMGDSNLHLNIPVRGYSKEVEQALEPWVYEWISKRKGSISAEHGLGLAKKDYVGFSKNETLIKLMRQIKQLFDPNGIMNPYKYI